jgi:hypothetical protein
MSVYFLSVSQFLVAIKKVFAKVTTSKERGLFRNAYFGKTNIFCNRDSLNLEF